MLLSIIDSGLLTDAMIGALAVVGGWIGWLIKKLVSALLKHLEDMKPEIRMLRMAINNNTLQHGTQLDNALEASMEGHEKTQGLVREQADRIVNKIEKNQ